MVEPLAVALLEASDERGIVLATAESCTGGMIAGAITDVPGSSISFDRGFVTYSNTAKIDMLGVEAEAIEEYGAVSPIVAEQMAIGAIRHSKASLSVSVTGIAGPGGGSPEKPVGLVHMAIAKRGDGEIVIVATSKLLFDEALGRSGVREATVRAALQALADAAALERP